MMYRIVLNETIDLYGTDENTAVLNPSLEVELNSAGTLSFTLPKDNIGWDLSTVFVDEVEVWEDDRIIWFGRPLEITRNWNDEKVISCEGALAYFNDSIQRIKEFDYNKTVKQFFQYLIDEHNAQVGENRQIFVGEVDPSFEDEKVYRTIDYDTTANCLQSMCLDTNGGYFILRKEYDDTFGVYKRYIDWVKELPGGTDQKVEFAYNMLDFNENLNGADICTVLLATGADDLDLSELGNKDSDGVTHVSGSDLIAHTAGVEKYGHVVSQKSWTDATTKEDLWDKAKEWLIEKNTDILTIECDAADLHYVSDYEPVPMPFMLGSKVTVVSAPHGVNTELNIYKISMNLDSGVKQLTIGTPPKRELSDIVKTGSGSTRSGSSQSDSGGGSGSGGSGGKVNIPVKKVKVNDKNVVKKKIANIKIKAGDNVNVSTDDDGEVTISASGNVQDVKVNGVDILDSETHIANVKVTSGDNISVTQDPDDGELHISANVPVKDVHVGGASVVDEQGIANVPTGGGGFDTIELEEAYWRNLGQGIYPSNFSFDKTVNITSGGIYCFIFKKTDEKYLDDTNFNFKAMRMNDEIEPMYEYNDYSTTYHGITCLVKVYSLSAGDYISIIDENTDLRTDNGDWVPIYTDKFGIGLVRVDDPFDSVSSPDPSSNPYSNGWYEIYNGYFVLTGDTSIVSGKTYYELDTSVLPSGNPNPYELNLLDINGVRTADDKWKYPGYYYVKLNDLSIDSFTGYSSNVYSDPTHLNVGSHTKIYGQSSVFYGFKLKNASIKDIYMSFINSYHHRGVEYQTLLDPYYCTRLCTNLSLSACNTYFNNNPNDYFIVIGVCISEQSYDMERSSNTSPDIFNRSTRVYLSKVLEIEDSDEYDGTIDSLDDSYISTDKKALIKIGNNEAPDFNSIDILNSSGGYERFSHITYSMSTPIKARALISPFYKPIDSSNNEEWTHKSKNSNNVRFYEYTDEDSHHRKCLNDSFVFVKMGYGVDLLNETADIYTFAGEDISLYLFKITGDSVTQEELADVRSELIARDAAVKAELQANFQDGVDDIYDACVSKGSTPVSHALADVVDAIGNIVDYEDVTVDYISEASLQFMPNGVASSTQSCTDDIYICTAEEVV